MSIPRYKTNYKEDNCLVKNGSSSNNYFIAKKQDVLTVEFVAALQTRPAKIKVYINNTSDYTKYLLSQGRLGLSLCKLNTGKSQRKHMCHPYIKDGDKIPKEKIKWNYHPRWSKCGNVVVLDHIDDEPITMPFDINDLTPSARRTLNNESGKWYTCIKATFVNTLGVDPEDSTSLICLGRAYKTHSNRIKVKNNNEKLINRDNLKVNYNKYILNNDQVKLLDYKDDDKTLILNNLNSDLTSALEEGKLKIGLEVEDIGKTRHASKSRRIKYGDINIATTNKGVRKAKRNSRYIYSLESKWYAPSGNFNIIDTHALDEEEPYFVDINECLRNLGGLRNIRNLLRYFRKNGITGYRIVRDYRIVIKYGASYTQGEDYKIIWRSNIMPKQIKFEYTNSGSMKATLVDR